MVEDRIPRSDAERKMLVPAVCVLAAFWLVLIYHLGAQWSVYEQYHYGWAVPFLCLYLLWRNGQKQTSVNAETTAPSSLSAIQPLPWQNAESPTAFSFSAFQLFSFFFLCLLYAPTRFLHEANPIWRLTTLLWTIEVIAITLLLLRTTDRRPRTTDPGPGTAEHATRNTHHASRFTFHVSRITFPILFFLVAVPWPSGLENFVTQSLMRLNSATTVNLLGLLGVPALQHGNVIEVGTGVVGIDEACSGIRSLQATLMISLFLGELYALTAWRRAFCVLAGFALAFAFNVGRTLLLTRVAAAKGISAVASWHDPAGVTIIVACFLCIWVLALLLKRPRPVIRSPMVSGPVVSGPSVSGPVVSSPVVPGPAPFSVSAFQRFSIFLTAWLLVVEAGTEFWYRAHERAPGANMQWSVQRPAQSSSYHEQKIPPDIRGQFNYDEGTQVRWEDGSGNSWQLYYFRWFPAHSLKKRVEIQLAKSHGPEICLPAVGMTVSADLGIITVPVAGTELAMRQYVFNADGSKIHVFYGIYEDPTGSSRLASRRQDFRSRVAAALAGSRNYGQRFLEVAVVGCERPEEAKAALTRELAKLIQVKE